MMYKVANEAVPAYLLKQFKLKQENECHNLRSTVNTICMFESDRPKTASYEHSFYCSGVQLWNALPASVKSAENISLFRNLCKHCV